MLNRSVHYGLGPGRKTGSPLALWHARVRGRSAHPSKKPSRSSTRRRPDGGGLRDVHDRRSAPGIPGPSRSNGIIKSGGVEVGLVRGRREHPLTLGPAERIDSPPAPVIRARMSQTDPRARLIVALRCAWSVPEAAACVERDRRRAATFYKTLPAGLCGGLALAERMIGQGLKVFLDLKLHDIGKHDRGGVRLGLGARGDIPHGPRLSADHAAGGEGPGQRPEDPRRDGAHLLRHADAQEAGYALPVADLVAQRAAQAAEIVIIDGLVCSAAEAAGVRGLVGPGPADRDARIRPAGADAGDQKRVMTPGDAAAREIDHVVVGRPITGAADPRAVAGRSSPRWA